MKLLKNIRWFFKDITVYALIGKSGTGKSFRAALMAERYHIDLLIDDGLLIKDQKILAGRSAKREGAYLSAVKTALFTQKDHRNEVLQAIEQEKFRRILILGTSRGMVDKIASNLNLPAPSKIISIEDVATKEEIDTAIRYRQSQGMHIIPVPSIEVKRNYPRIFSDSIRILWKKFGFGQRSKIFEKTVVRPEFSKKGKVTISEGALTQMIIHCIDEFSPELVLQKVVVKSDMAGYRITIYIGVPFGVPLAATIQKLQKFIIDSLEKYTGVNIIEMDIVIDKVTGNFREQEKNV
ncbi:MAG: hypothetical protein ACLFST_08780 [Spirochaetia bacterium]